jgi:hypothetical protein
MATLRSNLIRLASTLPKGDTTRREILSVLHGHRRKEAGESLFRDVVDMRGLYKLVGMMEKTGDKQSADLLRDVMDYFYKRLDLTDNEDAALNRLKNGIHSINSWEPDLHRNNIFKIANLLGMKLPSSMF